MRFCLQFVFVLLITMVSLSVRAQVVEDLSGKWEEVGTKTFFNPNDQISVELNLETFPLSFLQLQVPEETVVFSGEKLWFYAGRDTLLYSRVKDLAVELGDKRVNLTLFKEGIQTSDVLLRKVVVMNHGSVSPVLEKPEPVPPARNTVRQEVRDFFVVAILVILFVLALYNLAYPYIFEVMASPKNILNAEDFSETGSMQKFFSLDVLFFVFQVNMITSLAFTLGMVFFHENILSELAGMNLYSLLLIWILGSFGLLILTIFKFIGIRMIAYLFDLGKLEFAHFFYLLRLIVLGVCALVLIVAFFLMNNIQEMRKVLEISFSGFFWGYLVGIGGLMLIMMNRLSFKKYHLFTYLCIAELVPFLILAKWIMVLGQ